jgi:hypothetical protein
MSGPAADETVLGTNILWIFSGVDRCIGEERASDSGGSERQRRRRTTTD